MPTIDTLRTAQRLEQAGLTPRQAEALTAVLVEASEQPAPVLSLVDRRQPPHPSRVTGSFKFWLVVSQTIVLFAFAAVLHLTRSMG